MVIHPFKDKVLFVDLDNTLYSDGLGVSDMMSKRIVEFLVERCNLTEGEAETKAHEYYLQYGLSAVGIIKAHQIDPSEYDKLVDGSLPLESILSQDYNLKSILRCCQARKWVFTNAGKFHAERVLNILGIQNEFEGIVYCDYSMQDIICKPDPASFHRAQKLAGVVVPGNCYFIDDSMANVEAAHRLGWHAALVRFDQPSCYPKGVVQKVHELPFVFPELFLPN